jgi:hypothetical protein
MAADKNPSNKLDLPVVPMNILISGCPRSGTSVCMDCFRVTFGEEYIYGDKFPREKRNIKKAFKQRKQESDGEYALRMHALKGKKTKIIAHEKAAFKKSVEMNPNGFWESKFTMRGIRYRNNPKEMTAISSRDNLRIFKVVTQGLVRTDPRVIDKVVYMVRHPRNVAKSQENLVRNGKFKLADGTEFNLYDEKEQTPEMYIQTVIQFARWRRRNKDIPVLFVQFDDLTMRPEETLKKIQDFIGQGDFTKAIPRIDKKLRRSRKGRKKHPLWPDAEFMYDAFIREDYRGILKYLKRKTTALSQQRSGWACPRFGQAVVRAHCESCVASAEWRKSARELAEKREIDWRKQPCAYEVAFKLHAKKVSVKDSIKYNHWLLDVLDDKKIAKMTAELKAQRTS